MKTLDLSSEIQLQLLSLLADFHDPKNERSRLKRSPFLVLHAIFHLCEHNEKKRRFEHYPSKELISDVAGISRCLVTEFITSDDAKIYVDIKRGFDPNTKRFEANRYVLKDWVRNWMKLFRRSGMLRGLKKVGYEEWLKTFKKRINNWLLPLIQKGLTIKMILDSVVNKLSTKIRAKVAAAKPLKVAGTTSSRNHNTYNGSRSNTEPGDELPIFAEFKKTASILSDRFLLHDGDLHWVMKNYTLKNIKKGISVGEQWFRNGIEARSPIKMFMGAMKKACFSNVRI